MVWDYRIEAYDGWGGYANPLAPNGDVLVGPGNSSGGAASGADVDNIAVGGGIHRALQGGRNRAAASDFSGGPKRSRRGQQHQQQHPGKLANARSASVRTR